MSDDVSTFRSVALGSEPGVYRALIPNSTFMLAPTVEDGKAVLHFMAPEDPGVETELVRFALMGAGSRFHTCCLRETEYIGPVYFPDGRTLHVLMITTDHEKPQQEDEGDDTRTRH